MTRLLETDLWFTSLRMPKIPVFYSFFPRFAGGTEQRCADPLNPHRFLLPPEVAGAIPADLQAAHSEWRNMSMLLFEQNPAARWTEEKPNVPKGKVEMFTLQENEHERSRRVWVYTPPNYDPRESAPCRLLICFDGVSYLSEIPAVCTKPSKRKDTTWTYVEVSKGRHDPINWRFQLPEGIIFLAGRTAQR